ncbi:hypothetical protein C1N78_05805 [Serratia marcescens]|nr:hypothetical protein C1N78_05805 [Serratia marcescens]
MRLHGGVNAGVSGRVWAFARCSPAQGEDWPGTVTYRNRCNAFTPGNTDFFTLYRISVIAVVDKILPACCTVIDTGFVSFIHVKGKFDV